VAQGIEDVEGVLGLLMAAEGAELERGEGAGDTGTGPCCRTRCFASTLFLTDCGPLGKDPVGAATEGVSAPLRRWAPIFPFGWKLPATRKDNPFYRGSAGRGHGTFYLKRTLTGHSRSAAETAEGKWHGYD
jgi:hypothetical protein